MARGHSYVGAEWRARWRASTKTGSPLFEGSTTDWNINQVALVHWSSFYDSIFEHHERPEQRIIENDDLLDKWVDEKGKEMEDRAKANTVKSNYNRGTMSAYEHGEVVIFDDAEWEQIVGEEQYEEYEEYEVEA
jgi:hypothetical protein